MSPDIDIGWCFHCCLDGSSISNTAKWRGVGELPGVVGTAQNRRMDCQETWESLYFPLSIGIGHWGDRNKNPPRSDRLSVTDQERASGTRKQQTLVVVAGESISRSDEMQAVLAR